MSDKWKIFIKELSKVKRRRAAALVLYIFICSLSLGLAGILLYGVLDWLLALPQMFRLVLSLFFVACVVVFFFSKVIKILNLGKDYIARLIDKAHADADAERAEQRRSMVRTGDRSEKIRTYNFPQNRVTDHRVGLTVHALEEILGGSLDRVLDPLIEHDVRDRLKQQTSNEA